MGGVARKLKGLNGPARLLYGLALLLEITGSSNAALYLFKKAIQKAPKNRWLHMHTSRLFLKKGQVDMALAHWKKAAGPGDMGCFIYWLSKSIRMPLQEKATRFDLVSPVLNEEPREVAAGWQGDGKQKEQVPGDTGLELLEKGKVNEALEFFFKELQSEKSDPVLLFNTGLALSKLGKHDQALFYYEKAQGLGMNNLELLNSKGYSLFNLGRFEEAQTCYELARSMAPGDYTIINNLAACYIKTGQRDIAQQYFHAAAQNNNVDALTINNLAMCLETCGQTEEAIHYFDRSLELCANGHEKNIVLINKVNCLARLMRYKDALDACEQMACGCQNEFELWALRAELLNELGRTAEAADCFRKALGLTG